MTRQVMIQPRRDMPGFEAWWLNPPPPYYQWDREGIPSSTWLASRINKRDLLDHAAAEGWEVVG